MTAKALLFGRTSGEASPALDSLRFDVSERSFSFAAGIGTLLCCAVAAASPVGLDDFDDPNTALFFSGPMSMSQQSSGILGGQRDLTVAVDGYVYPDSVVGLVGYDNTPGYDLNALQIGMAGESPAVVTLEYSGIHSTQGNAYALGGSPGAPFDLTYGGAHDSFGLHFQSLDSLLEASITITSPAGSNYGAQSSTVSEFVPPSSTPFDFQVPFDFLEGTASASRADSVTFVFNGNRQPNLDFEFQLGAVPEPGSAVLLAAGLVALCGLRLALIVRTKSLEM